MTARALKTNEFAAQFAARNAAYELEHRYQAVERVAASQSLRKQLAETLAKPELHAMSAQLSDPKRSESDLELLKKQFLDRPDRRALQEELAGVISATSLRVEEKVASWFFCDANGVSMVRVPEGRTIGTDFAWRSYFYGGTRDMGKAWRPAPGQHVRGTTLSAVFRSQATSQWTVAISTPVFDLSPEKKFLGVLAMTAEVGRFVQFPGDENQFAVLVDNREGKYQGVVVQHPLFDALLAKQSHLPNPKLPDDIDKYRVGADDLPDTPEREEDYRDPLAADPAGGAYQGQWLASMEPVVVRGKDTGWIVIVQEAYDTAIGATLDELTRGLIRSGLIALGLVALAMAGLWGMAKRMSMNDSDKVNDEAANRRRIEGIRLHVRHSHDFVIPLSLSCPT